MLLVLLSSLLIFKQQVVGLEPECQCSRFHYEERTLEKIIKTEIFVDKMKSEIESRLNRMAIVVDEMKSGLENKLDERVGKIQKDCDEELNLLRNNISDVAVGLQAVTTNKVADIVTFLARDVNNAEPSDGTTLIFTAIEMNEGRGYDSSTGIFTAPVGGVYMFSLQLCLTNGRYFYWKIMADYKEILVGCFVEESESQRGCGSATGVAVISARSKIFVKVVSSSSGTDITDADIWNYFSGTLINHR